MKDKPRFTVNCDVDKEYGECEFNISDSWADYGAIVTFHLPYPYEKSRLDKKLKESKIALREDYDNFQHDQRTTQRFFTIGALVGAVILAVVISQTI